MSNSGEEKIPPSFEYRETFGHELDGQPLPQPRANRVRKLRGWALIGAVSLAAGALLPNVIKGFTDHGPKVFDPHVAADYPTPPADYKAVCAADNAKLLKLRTRVATSMSELFAHSPAVQHRDTQGLDKVGYFGNVSFEVPAEGGKYYANLIAASDGHGSFDPESAYTLDLGAVTNGKGAGIDVMIGYPGSPDGGGPNYPADGLYVSLEHGSQSYDGRSWDMHSTPEQCDAVLAVATKTINALQAGMIDQSPVTIPERLGQ